MNTENWYPSEEEYTPNLSKDDWLKLLQDEKIFDYNSMCMMRRMKDIGGEATCKQLADKYGKTPSAYVAYEKALAKRILDNSNCNAPENVSRFSILFFGKFDNDNIHYIWKLRPELSAVLDEIDLTKYELYEENSMNTFQDDCVRFKKLLEFFVAYLNYTIHNSTNDRYQKTDTIGYEEYIKPIVEGLSFSGQGYKGHRIQDPIKSFDTFNGYRIFINSNAQIRPSSNDYLNWKDTAYNIICKWKDGVVSHLQYVERISKEDSDRFEIADTRCLSDSVSVSELGLFDYRSPNKTLKEFYVGYYKEFNDDLYNKLKKEIEMEKIENCTKLLQTNHNLILTGAPGTGKTHLAKEIAKAMGCTDNEIGFVQFHPSYDYTDFVEGLRPKNDDDGNVGFERKDGVFKEFCKRALSNKKVQSNFDEVYEQFIDFVSEENDFTLKTLTYKKEFYVKLSSRKNLVAKPKTDVGSEMTITKENLKTFFETGTTKDWKPYVTAICDYIKNNYHLEITSQAETNENKNFVFIIDEINRGEISKIFGELFFSIDPGYRGLDGKVQTQYQNLVEEGDEFFNGFYVPENVYIIGTMNDIDRSVESMDFAFRRRFVFKEVSAEESAKNMGITNPAMKRINDEIAKPENELGKDYQLGGAYFLDDMSDQERWDLKISGLIKEYLRGIDTDGEKFKRIEKAYFGKNQIAEKQDAESQVEETE